MKAVLLFERLDPGEGTCDCEASCDWQDFETVTWKLNVGALQINMLCVRSLRTGADFSRCALRVIVLIHQLMATGDYYDIARFTSTVCS
jgi:hypothetical protein